MAWTLGATPWAENTTVAPSGTSVSDVDEHRAALAQLLDHVLVVDDLLAHVDGRAVQLERALDRLDGPIDAGAVAARRASSSFSGHAAIALKCRGQWLPDATADR